MSKFLTCLYFVHSTQTNDRKHTQKIVVIYQRSKLTSKLNKTANISCDLTEKKLCKPKKLIK